MEIKKICVLGAGTMGHGITQLMAQNGYEVSLRDIEDRFVQGGLNSIKKNLQKFSVEKGKMTQSQADAILARINGTTDLKKAVAQAQLVIESISEEMPLKKKVFKELDEVCSPETILASNTSGLSITAMGAVTKRPDKVVGMHFFNPPTVMKLVEIIPGTKTSNETYNVIKELSIKLGKEVITSKDSTAFIVNRMFIVLVNEAAKIIHEGIATPEDVDKGCRLGLGHAMGPLTTIDMTGIDIGLHVAEQMLEEFGDAYHPCPLLKMKVRANELGIKTGKGFYDHSK